MKITHVETFTVVVPARPGTWQPHHLGQVNTPLTRAEWRANCAVARAGRLPDRLWTELYFQTTHDPTRRSTTSTAHRPKGFAEKRAIVDGVTIRYTIGGQGPGVVLLHGYAQTSHMWMPLIPRLTSSHTVSGAICE